MYAKEGSYKVNKNELHKLNQYNKLQVLRHLQNIGCDEHSCKILMKKYKKIQPGLIKEYLERHSKNTQSHVTEECENTSRILQMKKWLEYFKRYECDKKCQYELGIVMKVIALTDSHPSICSHFDIDFEKLYNMLSDLMRGKPIQNLNDRTELFLYETYKDLIGEIKSNENEREIK